MKKMYAALLAAAMMTAGIGLNVQAAGEITAGETAGYGALAVGNASEAKSDQSTAIGQNSVATNKDGVTDNCNTAVGAYSHATGGHASSLGASAYATGNNSTALGYQSSATEQNSVALGAGSVANEANTVSVGAAGAERQIVNVEAGDVTATSTDAVNGSQLYATNQQIGYDEVEQHFKAITATDANGTKANDLTYAVNMNNSMIHDNAVMIEHQGQQINALSDRVSDLGGEIDNVGAISAALAGLHPLDYDGTGSKFQLAAAMGNYDGSQALALGGFYHFNEDLMMSVGGATAFDGDKKTAFNVGLSVRVGQGSSGKKVNADDVMAQLAAMNDKIAALEAENQKLTEKVAALEDGEAAPAEGEVAPEA